MNIYVYTGPVKSGKTTKLMQWASDQKNIDGIFQPVVDEKRYIYQIGSRTLKLLESTEEHPNNEIVSIGKYKFLKSTFDWSQNILIDCLNKKLDWLIIDEIGPLEMDGKGLEPAVSKILNNRTNDKTKILCVVRKEILEKFITNYNLQNSYEIFKI